MPSRIVWLTSPRETGTRICLLQVGHELTTKRTIVPQSIVVGPVSLLGSLAYVGVSPRQLHRLAPPIVNGDVMEAASSHVPFN